MYSDIIDIFNKPVIQVAGILDRAEAEMLVGCGVNLLGFPLRLDYHKEDITDNKAAEIIKIIKAPAQAVLITYLNKAEEIATLSNFLGTKIVQIHGSIEIRELKKLKKISPEIFIIKSIIIGNQNEEILLDVLASHTDYVDVFITDTYDHTTGASGATGKTHNWDLSKAIAGKSKLPVILAGGLTPENIREAILKVEPAGVDIHTGVEDSSGRKDYDKVTQFVKNVNEAFREIQS